jgi:RND family efflux transporter MFP subunit
MSKRKKILIAAVIVVLLGSYICFAIWNISHSQANTGIPKNAIPVETESSHIETIVCKVSVKGTVELIDVETVFPRTSAIVDLVYVKEGAEVAAGQPLLDYDGKALDNLKEQLASAKLSLKSAQLSLNAARTASAESDNLRLENARTGYNSAKTLYEAGGISKQELEAAYESMIRAEDQIKNAHNQIGLLEVGVEQNELMIRQIQKEIDSYALSEAAPVSGTIIASYVKKGDTTMGGRQLFEIADVSMNNLTIIANVAENDARNLALQQNVEIICHALGQTVYQGIVRKISPVASIKQIGNSLETALTVEISCNDAPLKAGYTVDATIITKIVENAVVVPLMSTVRESDGKNYVYIMRDDYSVEKRMVELGEYAGIYVEVSNMAEGEKTILNASAQIKEGVFVKPVVFYAPESRYDH